MSILTVNVGSSSLKLAVYETKTLKRKAALAVERVGSTGARLIVKRSDRSFEHTIEAKDVASAIDNVFQRVPELFASGLDAIGHRVVHGGGNHPKPAAITPSLLHELRELGHLDPTHMPQSLSVIDSMTRRFSNVPQFACFDTAFHHSMPDVAHRYPLPAWTKAAGVRRYGFHGLSCESIIDQLKQNHARRSRGRLLIAHLGNGASVSAVRDCVSVDTSMGFSPTGGLMMGTRSGDLDPTVIIFFARARAMTPDAVEKVVNEESGLLGVSGQSPDMRDLLERAASDSRAADAIELYCYIARKHFGALAAVLGGVDTIVFTGGIGERAPAFREKICAGLEYLGVQFDPNRNEANESVISADESPVDVGVIATDEDLVIARHVVALLRERNV
jgi:acetate kinase